MYFLSLFRQNDFDVSFYFFSLPEDFTAAHMDSYSGSCPQQFISFRLGMTSEKSLPEFTTVPVVGNEETVTPEIAESLVPSRPSPQVSEESRTTEESVTAFIERTVDTLSQSESDIISPLPSQQGVTARMVTIIPAFLKASVSDPIAVRVDLPNIEAEDSSIKEAESSVEAQGLFGDTTDAEDLMDSSGVAVYPPVVPSVTLDPTSFPELEGEFHEDPGHSDSEQEQYRSKLEGTDRQLSAKGKLIIKKYFRETRPIELPRDHPVIALTADEMHAVLRTVSDESVLSSYHMMKSLLLHATRGAPQDRKRPMPKRCATPARPFTDSSGDESSYEGHTSDGDTSGAFNTDEDPYQLGSISGTDYLSETDPLALTPIARTTNVRGATRAETATPTSGSGYSSTDYQPLSTIGRLPEQETQTRSPPRKRRRLLSKPGKVMKDAYFKGIQWTRTFVSGPVDPVHNKFKFYCMLCKTNVSIFSKGARGILRHHKTEGHLRKDQKWRYTHLRETNEVTGVTTYQVRGKDGYVLTPIELEREKPKFIDVPLVETGDRFPFYDDYMASIGGITNPDDLRTSTLISLIGTFVPKDGNISLLQSLWTRVGVFTNHQALFSSFDWGSVTLTVSRFSLVALPVRPSKFPAQGILRILVFCFRIFSITFS